MREKVLDFSRYLAERSVYYLLFWKIPKPTIATPLTNDVMSKAMRDLFKKGKEQ